MNEPQRLRAAEPSAFFITPEEDGKAGEPLVLLSLDTARKPLDFFTKPDMRGAFVQLLAGHVQKLVDQLDPATKAGRDALKSIAYRITRTKTTVDEVGKDEVARLKALPTQVDAGRRELRDALDALAEEVRKPVTEHEARIALADDWLARVAALPERLAHASVEAITDAMDSLREDWPKESWHNWPEAMNTRKAVFDQLGALRAQAVKREEDAAELKRLRDEDEKRKAAEREEELRKEGEARALARAAEQPLLLPPTTPEPARTIQMGMAAQVQASPTIAAAPLTVPQADALRRGAPAPDVEHRRAINRQVMEDLRAAMTPDRDVQNVDLAGNREALAIALVRAIATGKVRHVAITY